MDSVAAAIGATDLVVLANLIQVGAGDDPFPYPAFHLLEKSLRRGVGDESSICDQGNICCGGFDIGDDVSREHNDALTGEVGEEIAKADAFFRIEPCGGLVDDEKLRIVEERLRYADALLHAAGVAAKRSLAGVGQIYQL